jgi:hypothetical protein
MGIRPLFWMRMARVAVLIASMRDGSIDFLVFSTLRFLIYRSTFDR